ncbi:4-(cytidine 5'-diphospho)-2-C-methyl-D-erythritol kinase [Agriterribacter sp.]|uniref:4-(cytidine 5'-diphospho)-2-C-methyl-D-erythritol kinase n=1 Tax=Agriterribacter sp. TaxID=2821509 RepID=UPI002B7DA2C5|nr:4-(cytidine 5'-diphospho)-2-C-methyl-D-erythritol kinase [Agriterribacter sp.]HRO47723.1 4-(cytidine 5'-diphospho)-2-C-methyl-D-erythritol kinase [Agriterribacter sp.]HRQ19432.1 4-(cytidine 5'-diphospho)-2-C-methyl-D-erythritol kinase [Agriterribacter sp.]
MVLFPNCKINIGLNITSKRADGYHNIATVFYPINWHDAVEMISLPDNNALSTSPNFTQSGLSIPGKEADNICLKAYQILKKDFPGIPPVKMHLHKTIPTGAGLGGGSANGAFTLLLMNKKFNLNLTAEQLTAYALKLGSDCPFFMINAPCYATGRGEQTESLPLDLSVYSFLIVHPGIHIQTAWAFSKLKPAQPSKPLKSIIQQPVETWSHELVNDFEAPVFREYPQIEEVKKTLYANGALYASLTGSGSAVYGIFSKNKAPELKWGKDYTQKIIQ